MMNAQNNYKELLNLSIPWEVRKADGESWQLNLREPIRI